jgi:hypothetical protein
MKKRQSAVTAKFGGLAKNGWGILLPASHRYRRCLGLSASEQLLIDQLLFYYQSPKTWPSISQTLLAAELGSGRSTVNEQLTRLRTLGLVATRESRFGKGSSTFFYCLEPYLAVLAMREGFDRFDLALWAEGNDRLVRFAEEAEWGTWAWDVADLEMFRTTYRVKGPPRAVAVPMSVFLADEPANDHTPVPVPPTQEESHIYTSIPRGLKTSVPKALKTFVVKEEPRTSERVPGQDTAEGALSNEVQRTESPSR